MSHNLSNTHPSLEEYKRINFEKTYFSPLNSSRHMRWEGSFGVGDRFPEPKSRDGDIFYSIESDFDKITKKRLKKNAPKKPAFGGTMERFKVFQNDAPPPGTYFKDENAKKHSSQLSRSAKRRSINSLGNNLNRFQQHKEHHLQNTEESTSEFSQSHKQEYKFTNNSGFNPTSPIIHDDDSLNLSEDIFDRSASLITVSSAHDSSRASFLHSDTLFGESMRPAFGSSSPRFTLTSHSETIPPRQNIQYSHTPQYFDERTPNHSLKSNASRKRKTSSHKIKSPAFPFSTTLDRFATFKSESPPPTRYNIEGIDQMLSRPLKK